MTSNHSNDIGKTSTQNQSQLKYFLAGFLVIFVVITWAFFTLNSTPQTPIDENFVSCLKQTNLALMYYDDNQSPACRMELDYLKSYSQYMGGFNCSDNRNAQICGQYNYFPIYMTKIDMGNNTMWKPLGDGVKNTTEIMQLLNCTV